MAFTLQNLLISAYRKLGQLSESVATGGSTTTVVDSRQAGGHGDDAWKNGGIFLIRDAAGASAAPEGEMALITGYTDSTGTFTSAASAWTIAPATGDTYGYSNDFYPYHTMIEMCNAGLRSLGPVTLIDTTTLDTAASQTEYTYAVAWKRNPPFRVDYQTKTGDANDNQWVEISRGAWTYVPATAGSTGLLILPQLPVSRDIRVWYQASHPTLAAYSDTVYESIDPELATLAVVEKALEWQNSRMQGGDDFLLQRWNDAKQQLMEAKQLFKVWKPKRKNTHLVTSRYVEPEEFNWPA